MPNPQQHAENRNWIESIMRWIPGFHGYLEREYRRESDLLMRTWLADRLDRAKPSIDQCMKNLTEQGKLDEIGPLEQVRTKIDTLVGRLRAAPAGYSGLFDYVRIDEKILDDVYQLDSDLVSSVERVSEQIELSAGSDGTLDARLIAQEIDGISRNFDGRGDKLA